MMHGAWQGARSVVLPTHSFVAILLTAVLRFVTAHTTFLPPFSRRSTASAIDNPDAFQQVRLPTSSDTTYAIADTILSTGPGHSADALRFPSLCASDIPASKSAGLPNTHVPASRLRLWLPAPCSVPASFHAAADTIFRSSDQSPCCPSQGTAPYSWVPTAAESLSTFIPFRRLPTDQRAACPKHSCVTGLRLRLRLFETQQWRRLPTHEVDVCTSSFSEQESARRRQRQWARARVQGQHAQ